MEVPAFGFSVQWQQGAATAKSSAIAHGRQVAMYIYIYIVFLKVVLGLRFYGLVVAGVLKKIVSG